MAFGTVFKMPLGTPAFHISVLELKSQLGFQFQFPDMCILEGSRTANDVLGTLLWPDLALVGLGSDRVHQWMDVASTSPCAFQINKNNQISFKKQITKARKNNGHSVNNKIIDYIPSFMCTQRPK